MKIPTKRSPKWIVVYLLSSLAITILMLSQLFLTMDLELESFNMALLVVLILIALIANFIFNVLGFWGLFYIWSFATFGLIVSSFITPLVLLNQVGGWELFVGVYLMTLIVGFFTILGIGAQVIHYFINRKREEGP